MVMLDAPVSGGEPEAIDTAPSRSWWAAMPKLFETVKPILDKMGASVVLVGDISAGNRHQAGQPDRRRAQHRRRVRSLCARHQGWRQSRSGIQRHQGRPGRVDGDERQGTDDARRQLQARPRIELHIKDLQNALDTAHALNVPVPLTANIMETLQALKIDDMGACDHSAIVRFYEKLAKVEVRK